MRHRRCVLGLVEGCLLPVYIAWSRTIQVINEGCVTKDKATRIVAGRAGQMRLIAWHDEPLGPVRREIVQQNFIKQLIKWFDEC